MIPLALGRIKASCRRTGFSVHVGSEAQTASAGKRTLNSTEGTSQRSGKPPGQLALNYQVPGLDVLSHFGSISELTRAGGANSH